jgi:hypothetical protein
VNQTEYRVHGVRVERLMPLTPLHVLYFDAEIQKTVTYQSDGRLPEGFFAKKMKRTTDRAHFLSEGPLPA